MDTVTLTDSTPCNEGSGVTSSNAARSVVRRGMFLASLPLGSTVWLCANWIIAGRLPARSLRTARVAPLASMS